MNVPKGWHCEPLVNVSKLIKDGTHGSHVRTPIGIPLCSAENITHYGTLNWDESVSRVSIDDYMSIHSKYEIQPGDLLLTVVGSIGRSALAPITKEKYTIQRSVAVIRVNKKHLDNRFMYQFSRSSMFQKELNRRANTTAQSGIYLGEIAKLSIILPPLPEQRKIAAILSSVDETIQATKETIEQTKKVKKGLMQELLTKGIGHTRFKKTEIGEIPEEWESTSISCIADPNKYSIVDGPFGSNLKRVHYRETGVPVIQSGFVTSGLFTAHSYVYIEENHFKSNVRSKVIAGDIVMAKIGAYCGKCALLPPNHPVSILAGNCMKITVNKKICLPDYLLFVLHYKYSVNQLMHVKSITAQPAITLSRLRKMRFPLPSIDEQKRITTIISGINDQIRSYESNLQQLQQIKKGLMQDLLTGKIRVAV